MKDQKNVLDYNKKQIAKIFGVPNHLMQHRIPASDKEVSEFKESFLKDAIKFFVNKK